jgi:MFS family permease
MGNEIGTRKSGKIHYAWWIFATCFFVNACVMGIVANTAGIYLQPVSSEFGWPLAKMNFYLTIVQIVMTITLPIAGFVIPRINIKIAIGLPCLAMGATYALSSLFQSLTAWYIAGIVLGICYGFLMYVPIPLLINNWFKKNVATVLGVVVAGASLVGAFTNPIGSMLIAEYGWRFTRVALGTSSLILSLPLVVLVLRYKPSDKGLEPYGAEETAGWKENMAGKEAGVGAKKAFKSLSFYTIFILSGLLVMTASMLQQVPGYAVSEGIPATVGATGVSCIMVGGIVGKILLGALTDRIGFVKTAILASCFGLAGVGIIMSAGGNIPLFLMGTSIFGVAYASIVIIPPMAVRGTFGTKDYSQIYSWVTVANGAFGALTPIGVGLIFDMTQSYSFAWIICLIAYCIVIILTLITSASSRKFASLLNEV